LPTLLNADLSGKVKMPIQVRTYADVRGTFGPIAVTLGLGALTTEEKDYIP
jgi:hypothetical protein